MSNSKSEHPPPLSPDTESPALHHTARYGPVPHLVFHERAGEPERTYRLRQLVRRPIIRQWIDGGKLYREPAPREVPRFELFFDLLFVAIIHQLADAAIEEPGGDAVARFILTFWPSWSIWEEACRYSNVSGSDDLLHRVWVLVGMACLLGYAANASAIELHPTEGADGLDSTAVHAAVAYWLIIKLTRVLVLFYYALRLPEFRLSQLLGGLAVLVPMFVYLPLVWVKSRHAQIILSALGIFIDLLRFDAIFYAIAGRYIRHRARRERRCRSSAGEQVEEDEASPWYKIPRMPQGLRIP
ncbi:hypothetical protein Q5752_004914, partial [Cryptotrichosporon argae]